MDVQDEAAFRSDVKSCVEALVSELEDKWGPGVFLFASVRHVEMGGAGVVSMLGLATTEQARETVLAASSDALDKIEQSSGAEPGDTIR
jgi:hypothetical protein